MTKYILNSGGIKRNTEEAKKFFSEAVNGLGKNPKILICLFALQREEWERKFAEIQQSNLYPTDITLHLELAFPEKFEEQMKNTDVLYIYGGDDHLLQYWLKKFNIPKIWEGKVVATSSASSHALSKYFWTCDWRQCMDGFGIFPIKFLAHYKSEYGNDDSRGPIDWEKAYDDLKNYKEDLPIYALKEGEFVIMNK